MTARHPAALAVLLLAPWGSGVARAQESLDDLDKPAQTPAAPAAAQAGAPAASPTAGLAMGSTQGKATTEVNGYLDDRFQFGWSHVGRLVPTADVPTISDLLEANIQLRVTAHRTLYFYTDLSLFLQGGGLYYDADSAGHRVQVADHDVVSLRPLIVPAELYLSYAPASWFNVLVGKKRITWGAGFAFNPTDLLNPPKDPTDPTFQRAGGWVARLEAPFTRFTVTGLFAPTVLYQQSGLPYRFLVYPGYPTAESMTPVTGYAPPSSEAHFLAALRLYALLWSSDLNLVYYFSNRYRDDGDFQWKSRLGLSLSRFFADWELHVEALGQLGTTRRFVDPGIAAGMAPTGPVTLDTVLPQRDRASTRPVAKVIVGTRRTFRDESTLSIEYYYQSDGYSKGEFQDYVRLLSQARALGLLTQLGLSSATSAGNGGLPVKFSFDPLRGHYLIAGYSRPRIADDWTVGLTVIVGLEDLSGTVSPMVSWQPREWLTVSATGFVPFYGLPVGTVCAVAPGADGRCPDAQSYSEYKLVPQDFRALLQARLYY